MFTSKDQVKLSNIYSLIKEMNLSPVLQDNPLGTSPATPIPTPGEYDATEHEEGCDSAVQMAASDLYKVQCIIGDLHKNVESMPEIEGWVAAKITLAADYLSSVNDWINHVKLGSQDCECDQSNNEPVAMFSIGYENEAI